jgi:hypothetical protein
MLFLDLCYVGPRRFVEHCFEVFYAFFCNFQVSSSHRALLPPYLPNSIFVLPMFGIIWEKIIFLSPFASEEAQLFSLHYSFSTSKNFILIV